MKKRVLDFLFCPACKGALELRVKETNGEEIVSALLICHCGKEYKVVGGIPRFVDDDVYSRSFSLEWKIHDRTQLDSFSRRPISEKQMQSRLSRTLDLCDLKNKLVLDAGCGSGRFAEVAARYGAEVICIDLSYAVESAYKNIGSLKNVHIIQADIFNLPLRPGIFDLVYSYGVLHHTPNAKNAFSAITKLVKPKGVVSIFVYSSYNKAICYTSNFWRIFTTRIPKRMLYYLSYISVPLYFIYRIPLIGNIGRMIFVIPMLRDWRWRVLDTFDWYSPKYQSKHTHWEVFRWFSDNGIEDINIHPDEVTMSGLKRRDRGE